MRPLRRGDIKELVLKVRKFRYTPKTTSSFYDIPCFFPKQILLWEDSLSNLPNINVKCSTQWPFSFLSGLRNGTRVSWRRDSPDLLVPCSNCPVFLLKPVKSFCSWTPGRRWSTRWRDSEPNDCSTRRRIWSFYGNITENHGNEWFIPLPLFLLVQDVWSLCALAELHLWNLCLSFSSEAAHWLDLAYRYILFGLHTVF